MWLNFRWVNDLYIYWPIILIGITVIVLFAPLRILYHRSRAWFAYSNVSDMQVPFLRVTKLMLCSGGFSLLDYIPWSFETSFWEICIALKHMLWV